MTVAELPQVTESESVTSTVAPLPPPKERLVALDVFRGMTIAGMLLVNNPGSWTAIYSPLEHAEWNGWTPTDLIFPFFLFIVGVTTHLSLSSRKAAGAGRFGACHRGADPNPRRYPCQSGRVDNSCQS